MRILLINDISCVGKCSLTVEFPLACLGGETVDILPTSILSTHTGGFKGYTFRDLSDDFENILAHWKSLNLSYDLIVSGYLANKKQIDLIKKIVKEFLKEDGIYICDPSCADNGKLYVGFDDEFIKEMRSLVSISTYTVPNITEARYLCDDFTSPIDVLLKKLKKLNTNPLITSYQEKDLIGTAYLDDNDQVISSLSQSVDGSFHGAGDVFLGSFIACIVKHVPFSKAIDIASNYSSLSVKETFKEKTEPRFGLAFEKNIPYLVEQIEKNRQ